MIVRFTTGALAEHAGVEPAAPCGAQLSRLVWQTGSHLHSVGVGPARQAGPVRPGQAGPTWLYAEGEGVEPSSPFGARLSRAVRQAVSGCLPSVDPPGIEPGSPARQADVVPLDHGPIPVEA